jgi:5'-3' exonuclease
VNVHLVDGTYELFRHFYAMPSAKNRNGEEIAAVRGVMYSLRALVREGATHIGVATDRVIESFRNDLWPGYKTGEGIAPELWAQFPLLEEGLLAWGLTVWPMVEVEADDALASAAVKAALDPRVDQVIICSPDKDLAQCVRGTRVVQRDRVRKTTRDEAGVVAKFGVPPSSIPDYLALVGDAADGFPGLPGWGPKSTATVLARFGHIDAIPDNYREWGLDVARAGSLAATLTSGRDRARLFRQLATLRMDVPVFESVDELEWRGPTPALSELRGRLAVDH